MDAIIKKLIKVTSSNLSQKLKLLGGIFGLMYFFRWQLGRNIPSIPELSIRNSIDSSFISQLSKLIPIAIPSYSSKEAIYTYSLGLILIFRSLLSIFVSSLNGKLLKALVTYDKQAFFRRVFFK